MGTHRRERRRTVTAIALGVLAMVAWWLAFARLQSVPSLATLAPAVGIGVALGVAVRGARSPRAATDALPLAAAAEEQLDRLDVLERRIVPLGDPWPQVVAGPTGVFVVALGPTTGEQEARLAAGEALAHLSAAVRGHVERVEGGWRLAVRGMLVVPSGAGSSTPSHGDVVLVAVDRLADALATGPVASMAAVERAVGSLSTSALGSAP